jgi:O-antigen/teichoic acid export membrane protein
MLGILLFLDLVKGFIDKRYYGGLTVVPILLMANVFLGLYYNFSVWYRLKDRTPLGAWVALLGALITVVLNYWWIPLYGYKGAAWVTLICYVFMSAATWYTGRKSHPVPYELGRMALYIGAALGFYYFAEWLKPLLEHAPALLWAMRILLFSGFAGMAYGLEKRNTD